MYDKCMTKNDFETVLGMCCDALTYEARTTGFGTAAQIENRVCEVMDKQTHEDTAFTMDFSPHPQAFPDIVMGEFAIKRGNQAVGSPSNFEWENKCTFITMP